MERLPVVKKKWVSRHSYHVFALLTPRTMKQIYLHWHPTRRSPLRARKVWFFVWPQQWLFHMLVSVELCSGLLLVVNTEVSWPWEFYGWPWGFGYLMREVLSNTQLIFLYFLAWIINTTFFFLGLAQDSILLNWIQFYPDCICCSPAYKDDT